MAEFIELIDARRKDWIGKLYEVVSARRAAFLIMPGNVQSRRLLESLLDVSLDRTGTHDILTLYELTERISEEDHVRLCQSHLEGNLILLIEEFHQPRTLLSVSHTAVVCNVVRRILPQWPLRDGAEALGSDGCDFMEVEVFIGRLESGFSVGLDRTARRTASQLSEFESATLRAN